MSSLLRLCALLLVLVAAVIAVFEASEELEDSPLEFDKRNFQYIFRNLPIGQGRQPGSYKRSIDMLSRDRANAFYRLG